MFSNTPSKVSLRAGILSPVETFGQSIASVAPTAAPAMIVSQVFALSGNGTWLAYLIATAGLGLVAANINQFARNSASPGSLYNYTTGVLPPFWTLMSAWSLVIAYIGTATALIGGLTSFANVFLLGIGLPSVSPTLLTVVALAAAGALAYRDVSLSARLMLALEVVAVAMIVVIMGSTLFSHGFHPDHGQLQLQGISAGSVRLGLVLAIFSMVGFESATSLGGEARNPLRSIPRAVMLSAVCSGLFFTICSYAEIMGFHGEAETLDHSVAPLHRLAVKAGLPLLGTLIDVSAVISFFSCALACTTAAARILFDMGRKGDLPFAFGNAHHANRTPHRAVLFAILCAMIPGAVLTARGVGGFDINGWVGTVATFGFLVAYIVVSVAAPLYLRSRNQLTPGAVAVSVLAVAVMCVAFAGSVYPVPPAPYNWLPYVFLLLLSAGVAYSFALRSRSARLPVAAAYTATESDFA